MSIPVKEFEADFVSELYLKDFLVEVSGLTAVWIVAAKLYDRRAIVKEIDVVLVSGVVSKRFEFFEYLALTSGISRIYR